jgi:hypothetical protein
LGEPPNAGKSFIGSYTLGMGFVLEPEYARGMIDKNPKNQDVLFPFLNGEDLNSRPDQSASRWAINFFDWPLDRDSAHQGYKGPVAADYPDCLSILEELVKPERAGKSEDVASAPWWLYWRARSELYAALAESKMVMARARHANLNSIAILPPRMVFSDALVVFAYSDFHLLAVLQGSFHTAWLIEYASSLRTDIRYNPSDCFETFPLPLRTSACASLGEGYHSCRSSVMSDRQEGLTRTYSRFNDFNETATDIQDLRDLHVEMDRAVAAAYGWSDLDLGHGFHETKQGTRFTISESARREVLARLLKLNHERYAEEVAQGLHGKAKGKAAKGPRKPRGKAASEPSLFGEEDG